MVKTVWPDLAAVSLAPTLDTLHLWSQVVGKVRLMLTPWENHGWHVPFYVSSHGLATGLIPVPGRALTMEFDFIGGSLCLQTSSGGQRRLPLEPESVASFHAKLLDELAALGIAVAIDTMPTELPDATRFELDDRLREFELDVARLYWRALVEVYRVFQRFRTRFIGKNSPIHLFWGAFDLAVTRFSGRAAPPHPGGAAYLNDAVAREAYCREVSSAGFWPNTTAADGPCFYSYAYPSPEGFGQRPVRPAAARFDGQLGEFLLPYAAVQSSHDPDATLLDFLQTTYEAAAELARWDRSHLEQVEGSLGHPPAGS